MQHLLLQSEERFLPYIIMMCAFSISKRMRWWWTRECAVSVPRIVRFRETKKEREWWLLLLFKRPKRRKAAPKKRWSKSKENVIRINDNGIYLHRQGTNRYSREEEEERTPPSRGDDDSRRRRRRRRRSRSSSTFSFSSFPWVVVVLSLRVVSRRVTHHSHLFTQHIKKKFVTKNPTLNPKL